MTDAVSQVASRLRKRPLSHLGVFAIAAGFDLCVLSLCLWFAAFAAYPASVFAPGNAALLSGLSAALFAACSTLTRAYRPPVLTSLSQSLTRTLPGYILLLGTPALLGRAQVPTLDWLGTATLATLPALIILRLLAKGLLGWAKSIGLLERRAVIAGGGDRAERIIRALAQHPESDIRVVAILDDRDHDRAPPQTLGVPNIGRFNDIHRLVEEAEIDLVLITFPLEAEARIDWILSVFKALPQRIHLVDFPAADAPQHDQPFGLILAQDGSFDTVRRWQKRAFDLTFGSLALLATSPIMLLAAIALRLETPGPIFFAQDRHGYANRAIPVLKFRSMHHNMADETGTDVVKRGLDPRVTRVGAFLRKSSIDELPQLFGVLRGHLSLIGPRPHALDARCANEEPFSRLVENYAARHRLPPGITGWAQVHGLRGGIERPEQIRQRVAHDLHYIENWSLWLDLRILLQTPLALLNTKNAY